MDEINPLDEIFWVEGPRTQRGPGVNFFLNIDYRLLGNRATTQTHFRWLADCTISSKTFFEGKKFAPGTLLPLEKISKNVDFSLWGKQCIVLPKWASFHRLAHCAFPLFKYICSSHVTDYTMLFRAICIYNSPQIFLLIHYIYNFFLDMAYVGQSWTHRQEKQWTL